MGGAGAHRVGSRATATTVVLWGVGGRHLHREPEDVTPDPSTPFRVEAPLGSADGPPPGPGSRGHADVSGSRRARDLEAQHKLGEIGCFRLFLDVEFP